MTADDPDEPTPEELAEEARIDQVLATTSDAARRVIAECHDAFGHGIPTLVLGDLGFWYASAARDDATVADAARLAAAISELYENGDESMQTIVATGFLEALPHVNEQGREVVELLPPPLREELRAMENWRPPEVTNE